MSKAGRHPPEVVAAVLADVLTGDTAEAAAKKHGVPARTVRDWRSTQLGPLQTREEFGALVSQYLTVSLHALAVQAAVMAEPAFIREHADHLHLLHGVLTDKALRIIAGLTFEPAGPDPVPRLDAAPAPDSAAD